MAIRISRVLLAALLVAPATALAQPSVERGLYASAEHRGGALMFSDLDDDVVWVVGHRFGSGLNLAVLGSHNPSNKSATFTDEGRFRAISQKAQTNRYGIRAGLARAIGEQFVGAASLTVLSERQNQLRLETVSQEEAPLTSSHYTRETERLIIASALEVQVPTRLLGPLATSPAAGFAAALEPWEDEQFVDGVAQPSRSDVTLSYGPYLRVPLRLALPRGTSLTVDGTVGLDFTRGMMRPDGGRYGTLHLPRGSVRASFSF